ncbi:MAG: hypothetical protein V3571_05800 [Pseudodesulfovibrio sp.]
MPFGPANRASRAMRRVTAGGISTLQKDSTITGATARIHSVNGVSSYTLPPPMFPIFHQGPRQIRHSPAGRSARHSCRFNSVVEEQHHCHFILMINKFANSKKPLVFPTEFY